MHAVPPDPALLVQTGEECKGWSRTVENRHGVKERACKCGRARIVKVTRAGLQDMFLPMLDGETLPPYFKLGEAKDAVEAAAAGAPLPKASRPARVHEYRNVGDEDAAQSYEQTKEWFRSRVGQAQQTTAQALATLGLEASATVEEIKKAVKRLKMQHHPDRNPGDEAAADLFRQVTEAGDQLLEAAR
jgi:hypothetical protein